MFINRLSIIPEDLEENVFCNRGRGMNKRKGMDCRFLRQRLLEPGYMSDFFNDIDYVFN